MLFNYDYANVDMHEGRYRIKLNDEVNLFLEFFCEQEGLDAEDWMYDIIIDKLVEEWGKRERAYQRWIYEKADRQEREMEIHRKIQEVMREQEKYKKIAKGAK